MSSKNPIADRLRTIAKLAAEGGQIAHAQALTGLAASLDKGRLSLLEIAPKLDAFAAEIELRVKTLETINANIRAAAAECQPARGS